MKNIGFLFMLWIKFIWVFSFCYFLCFCFFCIFFERNVKKFLCILEGFFVDIVLLILKLSFLEEIVFVLWS